MRSRPCSPRPRPWPAAWQECNAPCSCGPSRLAANTFNLKILLILSFGHLATDIYQGALPAILPFLKTKLSLSYTTAGVVLMAANFTSSILQPVFGHFSDKKEKILLLPLGVLAAGLGLSLASLPDSYGGLLLMVIMSGLGVAAFHPEGFKTASFFTGEKAATGMSVFAVGGNLGLALGPLFSLAIITYLGFGGLPLMLVFALLFQVLLFFNWGYIRSAKPPLSVKKAQVAAKAPPGAYLALFLVIATVVMRSWTQLGIMTYIPFYFIEHLQGDPCIPASWCPPSFWGVWPGPSSAPCWPTAWAIRNTWCIPWWRPASCHLLFFWSAAPCSR
jgi:MFS transporter, FSR family, fosmidomycin resistance protein